VCDECFSTSPKVSRRRLFAWAGALAVASTSRTWDRFDAVAGELATSAGTRTRDAICREAWGARKPTGGFRRHTIRRLTVHHSGSVLRDNSEAPQRFRSYQAGHQAEGWPDIAYHMLIDRHGNIYRARPHWAVGDTRTNYSPRGHLLVMCEGNFSAQQVSHRQVVALVDVLAWACKRFDVRPRTIEGHRDYAHTACPGDDLYRLINRGKIQQRVKERLAWGGVALNDLCGRAGKRRVEKIEAGRDL
jgi:N-acetylmuramoyl-L-alanine amidase